ncbi:hypothetical protein FGK64_21480 [Arenibacterium halophilum]|uniref:Uncharacterized protein n=1 Tax=Arenibacterium halophilum TaxID=2583821 RepID=A0ABY2WX77_9RHOB|nr:hypothetical protein FGK64_21480 [Arenibacterium halophilum]
METTALSHPIWRLFHRVLTSLNSFADELEQACGRQAVDASWFCAKEHRDGWICVIRLAQARLHRAFSIALARASGTENSHPLFQKLKRTMPGFSSLRSRGGLQCFVSVPSASRNSFSVCARRRSAIAIRYYRHEAGLQPVYSEL